MKGDPHVIHGDPAAARGWSEIGRGNSSVGLMFFIAAILTIATILAAGLTVLGLRDRTETETRAGLARLALVVAEETSRSLQAVDLVLTDVMEHVAINASAGAPTERVLASRALHDLMAEKVSTLEQVRNLILIGADGAFLNNSLSWPVRPLSLADREQYRYLRDHDDDRLFVSEPVVSKLDGQWTVYVARRINDRAGAFAGVVQAAIKLNQFEDFFGAVSLGKGSTISLLRADGVLLAAYPPPLNEIGQTIPANEWRASDLEVREITDRSKAARYVATHGVSRFPLYVSVTMSKAVALGSWRRDATVLLLGASGAALGIFVLLLLLGRQIRSLRRSEELLARQNGELIGGRRLLLDAQRIGKLGHYTSSLATESAVWSPQLFEIAGLPAAPEVSLDTMTSLIHPDDVADYIRARDASLHNGSELIHEHRWVRPDGSVRWVRLDGSPQFGPDRNITGFFGIVQDITDRKQAQQVAEESRVRLHDAIESLPEGFILYDSDDRFVLANTRFREMFPELSRVIRPGMTFEDIMRVGVSVGAIQVEEGQSEDFIGEAVSWHFAGSKPRERKLSDGRWIQFIDHRTSDGGTAGLRSDITAFKNVEAALEHRLADLERTRSELEAQKEALESTTSSLILARDAAEAANRAKSDFLAIMSHEIRTPLSGMVGMIDLLHDTVLNADQRRYAGMAKESAAALLDVINNILDFSKLEATNLKTEEIDFELAPVVSAVTTLLDTRAGEKGLALHADISPKVPAWLKGDPGRIRQILLNLVSNAIKFTERGEVRIVVSHRLIGEDVIELRTDVKDTGIGIPREVQQRLFQPFVQADTSISRTYGGSGLGLAICRQLCALMGGEIGIESEAGRGSTFWFTVRCRIGVPFVEEPQVMTAPAAEDLSILVAEDSPIIATLISSLLKAKGYSPDMVVNGKAAVEAVRKRQYDVVLMDVQMPEMDGISATRAIRKLDVPWRSIPIVALTANALVGQRETYLAAGMTAYVTKPIQPAALFEAIFQCTAKARGPSRKVEAAPQTSVESAQVQHLP